MVVYRKGQNLFYVNFKCGYSTFERLREAGIVKYYYGRTKGMTIYFITRDPYKRLESFYREKMIKNVNPSLNQYCQQKLLHHFPKERLINRKVTFQEFIKALEAGYNDEHIALQSGIINCPIDHRIKLERGLWELTPVLGVNPDDYISNVSKDILVTFEWTKEMRMIVNKLYAADFINMQYNML